MALNRKNRSRYALMSPSNVLDEQTGEAYPDILSIDFSTLEFTSVPRQIRIRPQHIDKFFNLHRDVYGTFNGDDILLELNIVPHKEYLEPGMSLYCPSSRDYNAFINNETLNARGRQKRKTL